MKTEALLLAAGFGSRLKPLTDSIPKPLVPVAGLPVIAHNLQRLSDSGFKRVFINLHYLAEQIRDYVGDGSKWGLEVGFSYEPEILDTGGAISAIRDQLFGANLLVLNSDVVIGKDLLLSDFVQDFSNRHHGAVASLILRPDPEADRFGSFAIDSNDRIIRMLDAVSPTDGAVCQTGLMFTGISVLSSSLLSTLPQAGTKFSLTKDVYRTAILDGAFLASYRYNGYWNDIGTPERLAAASNYLNGKSLA